MTKRIVIAFALTLLSACQSTAPQVSPTGFAFTNVSVIDATHGHRKHMTVVVDQTKIQQVSPTAATTLPDTLKQIDASGQFLIPGLWDMHVHLTYEPELEPHMFDLFLAHGVTSVRDTGGELHKVLPWRDKARANPKAAPQVFIAGPLIDGAEPVYNGTGGLPVLAVAAATPAEVRQIVDELAAADVDLLKAYEMLTPETFLALMDQAKKHELPVTGHVPLSMDAISVSEAGLTSVEHLRNIPTACAKNADELKRRRLKLLAEPADSGAQRRSKLHTDQRPEAVANYDDATCAVVLSTLARNQTWQIPTTTLNLLSKTRRFVEPTWQHHFALLPQRVSARWRQSIERVSLTEPAKQYVDLADWTAMILPKMLDAGVRILPGTDTPIFFLTPGISLHQELETLVHLGMTPEQVLAAATYESAKYFGMEKQVGDVTSGKTADLVLLKQNPLENISATQSIIGVVRQGHFYDATGLRKLRNTAQQTTSDL